MKKLLQIIIVISGLICAVCMCALGGIYITRIVKRIRYTYTNISNCFKPIDYIVEDYE